MIFSLYHQQLECLLFTECMFAIQGPLKNVRKDHSRSRSVSYETVNNPVFENR